MNRPKSDGIPEPFHPTEETIRILVLLSEKNYALDAPECEMVRRLFQALSYSDDAGQLDLLTAVLYRYAMPKLVDALDGGDLVELIKAAWRAETGFSNPELKISGTVDKVVEHIGVFKLEGLADYCILNPLHCDNVLMPLREYGKEKGQKMAELILERMKKAYAQIGSPLKEWAE
jgi:hypothetical protein